MVVLESRLSSPNAPRSFASASLAVLPVVEIVAWLPFSDHAIGEFNGTENRCRPLFHSLISPIGKWVVIHPECNGKGQKADLPKDRIPRRTFVARAPDKAVARWSLAPYIHPFQTPPSLQCLRLDTGDSTFLV